MRMLAAVLLVSIVAGCGEKPQEVGTAFRPTPAFVEGLKGKARELAESELAKFNAADRAQMNEVVLDQQPPNEATTGGGVYYKRYREFTRAEVTDIRQTGSYLKPVAIEIRYDYRLVGTLPQHSDAPDSRQKAAAETEYKVLRERKVTRVYPCDANGNYDGSLPDIPPADNFFFAPETQR